MHPTDEKTQRRTDPLRSDAMGSHAILLPDVCEMPMLGRRKRATPASEKTPITKPKTTTTTTTKKKRKQPKTIALGNAWTSSESVAAPPPERTHKQPAATARSRSGGNGGGGGRRSQHLRHGHGHVHRQTHDDGERCENAHEGHV